MDVFFSLIQSRGGTGGGPCPSDDSWYFDNDKDTWTELPRCATPRVWSAMAPLTNSPGKALLYGGSTSWSEQVITVRTTYCITIAGIFCLVFLPHSFIHAFRIILISIMLLYSFLFRLRSGLRKRFW